MWVTRQVDSTATGLRQPSLLSLPSSEPAAIPWVTAGRHERVQRLWLYRTAKGEWEITGLEPRDY